MRVIVLGAAALLSKTANAADLPLLPKPESLVQQKGSFSLAHARIAASAPGERAARDRLRSLLARSRGPAA